MQGGILTAPGRESTVYNGRMSRVLFATDIHGNRRAYGELFDHAAARGASAIVFGGDVTPLPPHDGSDPIGFQRRWIGEFMAPAFRSFRAAHPSCSIYTMLGNDDWLWNADLFQALEREGACRLLHAKAQPFLDGLSIAGYSCVPLTPFAMKDLDRFDTPGWAPRDWPRRCWISDGGKIGEVSVDEIRRRGTIEEDLEALGGKSDPGSTVYVVHTPPLNTKLDVLFDGTHIGSGALRSFLEEHRPPLSLHGHIHESPQMSGSIHDRIGPTLCINPGASIHYLQAVTFDLANPAGTLEPV